MDILHPKPLNRNFTITGLYLQGVDVGHKIRLGKNVTLFNMSNDNLST